MKKRLEMLSRLRNRDLLMVDILLVSLAPWISFYVRTESLHELRLYTNPLATFMVLDGLCKLLIFYVTGLYAQYWRYASVQELATLLRATILAAVVEVVLFFVVFTPIGIIPYGFPRSLPVLDGLFSMLFVGAVRFSVRLVQSWQSRSEEGASMKPTLIVGAGVAGAMIVKELQVNRQLGLLPVGYVDDNLEKVGKNIHGVPVLGTLKDFPRLLKTHHASQVIIAMPTASGKKIREVVQVCKERGVTSKIVPALFEILRGTARVDQFRNIQLEDLLRRGPVKTDTKSVVALLHGTRVMVTGAGGSIGSEICRQVKEFGPTELILLGHGENSIFRIANELMEHPKKGLTVRTVIADIRDKDRMNAVFEQCRPTVIFHAAAHKHVPLMEVNVSEAVTNNVLGTRNLVELSEKHGVERFVMISSDKAVNPTSVMGVSKRIAELIVQEAARRIGKTFVTVRFGNVLGSSGSVVPVFKRQIEMGGPVTVTHPEVKRFFMTIPEAVQLVLQAATMGTGGETFVLDMGEQIPVVELARDMIRLNGLEEGRDIDIVFTGLRPGEKMYEELFYEGARIERTTHEKILVQFGSLDRDVAVPMADGQVQIHQHVVSGMPGYEDPLAMDIDTLIEAAHQGSESIVLRLFGKLVPQFRMPDHAADAEAAIARVATGGVAERVKL